MFEKSLVLKMHYQTIESNLLLLRAQSIYSISIFGGKINDQIFKNHAWAAKENKTKN
jgi:hypothetical protein